MKRIILGVLVLIGAWQLIQLPSVNAALFAFLALGINPVTNHPFSTPSLLSILITLGFVSILLLFSRLLGDFFGGLYDWLTQASRDYGTPISEAESELAALGLSSLPVHRALEEIVDPKPRTTVEVFGAMTAALQTLTVPTFGAQRIHPYITRLAQRYRLLIEHIKFRARTNRTVDTVATLPPAVRHRKSYKESLAPELAEVVNIFERLAVETAEAEPQEAVIVEPKAPNAFLVALQHQLTRFQELIGMSGRVVLRDAQRASIQAGTMGRAAEQQAGAVAHEIGAATRKAANATYQGLYRGILLAALGILLTGGVALHAVHVIVRILARTIAFVYRQSCRALVFSAITITLGMFAAGRGIVLMIHAIGRGLAVMCRSVYRLLAFGTMLSLLAAGYLLYVFSLTCFMVWEIGEPYARRLDKLLGDTIDSKEGWAEMAKVGHEMSRTFAQWYREIRQIMHSTYR